MIVTFQHKGLEAFFKTGSKAGIIPAHEAKLRRQLAQLSVAPNSQAMNIPGWRLHQLSPPLVGHWAVDVNGNWRLTFTFINGDAHSVNYLDYH